MARMNLIDIARQKADDGVVPLLNEAAIAVPEVTVIGGQTVKDTEFTTLIRTKLPTVGFRDANNGVDADKSSYQNRTFKAYPLTPRFEVDEVVADQHPKGWAGALADEAIAMMTASLIHMARCFWYGTSFDAKAFPGVRELVLTANTIDAGGSGNSQTETFLICNNPLYSQWIFGNNGRLTLSDPRKETLTGSNSKPLDGYVQTLKGYIGAMHRSPRTLVRIKGITASSKLTDAMLLEAFGKFPDEAPPTDIFVNMLGQTTLTSSRVTAEVKQPKLATDWNGIPIHRTGAIVTGAAAAVPSASTEVSTASQNE